MENPRLLNQLSYTAAVIRESLRIFPAASNTRVGVSGFNIRNEKVLNITTDGFLVWQIPQTSQCDPAY